MTEQQTLSLDRAVLWFVGALMLLMVFGLVVAATQQFGKPGSHKGQHCVSDHTEYTAKGFCSKWAPNRAGADYGDTNWTYTNGY